MYCQTRTCVTTRPDVLRCSPRPRCALCPHTVPGRHFYLHPSKAGLFPSCWSDSRVPRQPQPQWSFGLGLHILSLQNPCDCQEVPLNPLQAEDVRLHNRDPGQTPEGCFRARGGKRDKQEIRLWRLPVPQSLCKAEDDKEGFGWWLLYKCCARNSKLAAASFANPGPLAMVCHRKGKRRLSRNCSHGEISIQLVSRTATHSKDEAEGRFNVWCKGRYTRPGCCKCKGCSMRSGFGLWQKSDASRQKKKSKMQGISINEN